MGLFNSVREWLKNRELDKRIQLLLDAENVPTIDHYSFSVNIVNGATRKPIILGEPCELIGQNYPDCHFKGSNVVINVPSLGMIQVMEIKCGRYSATIGGIADGFVFNPNANAKMTFPGIMSPNMNAMFLGGYTGHVPVGFVYGNPYPLFMTFKGIGTMTPGRTFKRKVIEQMMIDEDVLRDEFRSIHKPVQASDSSDDEGRDFGNKPDPYI